MKWYIAAVIGLFVLVPLGFGVWKEFRVEAERPTLAERFKASFVASCSREAEVSITAAGHTVDDALKAKVNKVCACGADATVADATVAELLKDEASVVELLALPSDPAFKARVTAIMQTCGQQVGTP